jgi:hypothetical protein
MASADKKLSLGTSVVTLFDAAALDTACDAFWVSADATNGSDVMVNVSPLHTAGEYFYVAPGQDQPFRYSTASGSGIQKVTAKMEGAGVGIVRYGVVARFPAGG